MKYDLVFEGGGAKGAVFVGALQAFEARGHSIGRVIGTSAGAITAAVVAAGYTSDHLLESVKEKLPDGKPVFSSFMDVPAGFDDNAIEKSLIFDIFSSVDVPRIPDFIERHLDRMIFDTLLQTEKFRNIFSFVELGGWYSGDKFLTWIQKKLEDGQSGLGDVSFAEFNALTERDLSLVAADISSSDLLILNHRTAPQCPVKWGVRMSMSVPFAWQEVVWQADWGTYLGRDITGHRIVDGGLLSNFPIEYLISQDKEVVDVMGPATGSPNVLGLLIDESLEVPGSDTSQLSEPALGQFGLDDVKELEIVRRISNLVDTALSGHGKIIIDAYQDFVCRLPAKGYGTLEFEMTDQRMEAIIEAGRTTMEAYFEARMGKNS